MTKAIWVVEHNGIMEYDSTSLTNCLRFIGQRLKGELAGWGLVTVAAAVNAGFSIRQC